MAKPKIRKANNSSPASTEKVKTATTESTKRQLRPRRHTEKAGKSEYTFAEPLPVSSEKNPERPILKARIKSNKNKDDTDTTFSNVSGMLNTTANSKTLSARSKRQLKRTIAVPDSPEKDFSGDDSVFEEKKDVEDFNVSLKSKINSNQETALNIFDESSNKELANESIILIDSLTEDIGEYADTKHSLEKINNLSRNQQEVNISFDKVNLRKRNSKLIPSTNSSTDISFTVSDTPDKNNATFSSPLKRNSLLEETAVVTDGTFEIVQEINESGVLKREHTFSRETPNKSGATNMSNIKVIPACTEGNEINVTFSPKSPQEPSTSTLPTVDFTDTPLTIKGKGTPDRRSLFVNKVTSTPFVNTFSNPNKTPIKTPNVGRLLKVNCTPHTKLILNESGNVTFKKSELNVTHSVEKPKRNRSLSAPNDTLKDNKRRTKVTFCSPVNVLSTPERRSMKHRRNSVADRSILKVGAAIKPIPENVETPLKRKLISQDSINRLSQPRTPRSHISGVSTTSKSIKKTSAKTTEKKVFKTKMPNFAAVHANNFEQMESLVDVIARKETRAQILATGGFKSATKNTTPRAIIKPAPKVATPAALFKLKPVTKNPTVVTTKNASAARVEITTKIVKPVEFSFKQTKPSTKVKEGFNRFGFKVTSKKENLPIIKPSTGEKPVNKVQMRRQRNIEVMKRVKDVSENKTRKILQGVRLNKRFELQMKSRNIDI